MKASSSGVHLREILELRIEHEREMRTEQSKSSDMALRLQAEEYERRLEILNIENARVAGLGITMLTKQEFHSYIDNRELWEREMRIWRDAINSQLNTFRGALLFVVFVVPLISLSITWLRL